MHFRHLFIVILLFAVPATGAYRWVAPDGTVIFSDNPPHPDAEEIKLPLTPTTRSILPPKIAPQKSSSKKSLGTTHYTRFLITQPENDQAFYDNSGNISVNINLEPALDSKKKHKIVIELDGATIVTTTSTQTILPNVDRGTHTLRARIIDNEGKTLIAHEIQFHLRRISVIN